MPAAGRATAATTLGLPPGSLIHVGERRVEHTTLRLIDYNAGRIDERDLDRPADCRACLHTDSVSWINVTGLHEPEVIGGIGEAFGLHPLVLEDILNTRQRPRCEDLGEVMFVVLKMLYRDRDEGGVCAEQVSMLLGRGWVLTFQEVEGDVFGLIRERLHTGAGRIRGMGADYLLYALVDAVVDHYFVVLEAISDEIEELQEAALEHSGPEALRRIHHLRGDMIFLRRHLWPVRELASLLAKSENPLVSAELQPFLRDVYEHTIRVIETTETLRDMVSAALEIHMTALSNRMNEVMKVLTLIATVFIPLTFVAGIYGMNFDHMPELHWRWGYAFAWSVMLLLGIGMLVFFKRKKWL